MKKFLLFAFLMTIYVSVNAQFSEDFNSVADGALPTGWTRFNVDGLTPHSSLSWVTDAWVCKAYGGITTKAAWSCSYYTPTGTANDWMFTPAITIPATYPVLQFTELAQDPGYPDGYELRISTTPPTSANLMSSTIISTVANAFNPAKTTSISLASYAGQTVYIGWRNKSVDMYMLGIDDVLIKSLPANGTSITSLNVPGYVQINTPQTIAGVLTNTGGLSITSLNLNYSVNGGTAVTQPLTGLNIAALATYNYSHSTIWTAPSTAGSYTIKVWASNINGNSSLSSDTISKVVNTLTTLVMRKVVLEEYTGIHCQYCPDGHKRANDYKLLHPNDVFLINIHQGGYASPSAGEPDFRTTFGDALANQTGLTGYPSGTINRHVFAPNTSTALDRGSWASKGDLILASPTYITLGITSTIDGPSRLLTVNTTANYLANGPAFNLINVALLQNNVEGPQTGGATYNPTQILPNGKYNHQHMLRHLLTGQWGDSIKVTTSGTNFQKTYTYTLPASINGTNLDIYNIEVIAFVTEGPQEIVTAVEQKPTSIEENGIVTNFTVYPNPAKNNVQLSFNLTDNKEVNVSIYNSLGAEVYNSNEGVMTSGSHTINIKVNSLSSGIYYMNVKAGDNTISKKLVIE